MQKLFLALAVLVQVVACGQTASNTINVKAVEQIEKVLSANNMKGRKVGTPGIDKAAAFIANEFKAAGLQTWDHASGYLQPFSMVQPTVLEVETEVNGKKLKAQNVMIFSSKPELEINEQSGYTIKQIKADENLLQEAFTIINSGKNCLVLINENNASRFFRLAQFQNQFFATDKNVVFLLTDAAALNTYKIRAKLKVAEIPMANVVGVLPGKSKPNEYVIFSAHYDHLGVGEPVAGDSIYNGANDDAAGTTAVIMLAKYFAHQNNNERTLVFATFTAEEIGGFGSQYFSRQFNAGQVAAMFNIEMIGTESKWGKNSAYITGYEKTDMGKILQNNLKSTSFRFYPDPYPQEQLFYRSDNATLARLGVPAHTISTAKMDAEPYYHSVNDEIETLDLPNMTAIINAIAQSAKSIIAGKDTPSRVNNKELN